jgi:hypothetical protein
MQSDDLISAFRHHRHDVLNGLQLIRGYVQLNRPDDAIRTIDRLAQWIQSLSVVQSLADGHSPWFSAACQSPHVRLTQCSLPHMERPEDDLLAEIWAWLEEQMTMHQIHEILVRIGPGTVHLSEAPMRCSVQVELMASPPVLSWWNSLESPPVWPYLRLTESIT